MLRSIFVFLLIAFGAYYTLQGPFYALLFYIGNAYFRPEDWVWNDYVASLRLSLISGAYLVLASLYSRQRFVWNSRIALLWLFLFHTLLSTLAVGALRTQLGLLDGFSKNNHHHLFDRCPCRRFL